jgi:hypothetical protein
MAWVGGDEVIQHGASGEDVTTGGKGLTLDVSGFKLARGQPFHLL